MVDAMAILGAAACVKLTADRLVRDLVTYFRETTIASPAPRPTTSRPRRNNYRLSRPMKPSLSGLGPRPSSRRSKKNVSRMTDAELEAELDNRRRRRVKERHLYSRAMRSEKLAALESDLADLRKEMGRIDPISSKPVLRQHTPHSVRWQPLPSTRRSSETASSAPSRNFPLSPPQPNNMSSTPPPPPPPPPEPAGTDRDVLIVDSETRKREKEERQRRREAKKKEREQSKKRMSLADIIRSAGPDPMKRLTPATKKAADLEKEEYDKQKKAREEREKRQEKERVEQEKENLENMGCRTAEQTSTAPGSKSQQSGKSGQPDKQPTNGNISTKRSQDSAVHGMGPDLKQEGLSDPTSASICDKESDIGMQDLNTGPDLDAIGNPRTLTAESNENSESDPERQTRSAETQNSMSLSIAIEEGGSGQPRQEHDKPHASNKPVNGPAENEAGPCLIKAGGYTDLRGDTENVSPNTSSVCVTVKEEPKKKDPKANEMSKCLPTP